MIRNIFHVFICDIIKNSWKLCENLNDDCDLSLIHSRCHHCNHGTSQKVNEVNKRNTRKRCEICSKSTIKTPERCHWRRCLYCQLWTYFTLCSSVTIVDFEYTFACWEDKKGEIIKSRLGKIFYHAGVQTGEKVFSVH